MNIISFFIPLVGMIIYSVLCDESPQKADSARKCAVKGFITQAIVLVLVVIVISVVFVVFMKGMADFYGP